MVYFILIDFWFPTLLFSDRSTTMPYVWKKYHKNKRHTYKFHRTHFDTSTCQMWLQLMIHHFIKLRFLGIFYTLWRPYMSELLYLHKLSQIMWLINVHILVNQYAKCECSLWKVLWFNCVSFAEYQFIFHIYVCNVITSTNFWKLFVKAEL